MTMEQSRRLAMLERRLETIDAARREDRHALVTGIELLAESILLLAERVGELEERFEPEPAA